MNLSPDAKIAHELVAFYLQLGVSGAKVIVDGAEVIYRSKEMVEWEKSPKKSRKRKEKTSDV